MSGTPDVALDAQRFPIGRFQRQAEFSAEQRQAHIARIAAQPANLAAAMSGLTATDYAAPYRDGGWTVRQLVHHMADSHANAYIRVKLALTEQAPVIKPYDQDAWAALPDATSLSPHVSVALFAATHIRLHAVLDAMTPAQFARTILHPENGAMTLDQVVALYACHGDHHIAQLERYRARSLSDRLEDPQATPGSAATASDGDQPLRERLNWLHRRVQRLQAAHRGVEGLLDQALETGND